LQKQRLIIEVSKSLYTFCKIEPEICYENHFVKADEASQKKSLTETVFSIENVFRKSLQDDSIILEQQLKEFYMLE